MIFSGSRATPASSARQAFPDLASSKKAEPYRIGSRLGAVGASGFRQDVMDVGGNRALPDREHERDIGIAPADREQAKHVQLSSGQIVRSRRLWRRFGQP